MTILNMKKIIFIIILVLAAGGFFFLPAVSVLSLSGRKNPDQVFYSAAACKEGFIISYTHSVNKGRVHDYYSFLPDRTLELYKTQFVSYGAGIPEPEEQLFMIVGLCAQMIMGGQKPLRKCAGFRGQHGTSQGIETIKRI